MKKLTLQELFDLNWRHFVVGKGPPSVNLAVQTGPRCLYNGPDGNGCGIALALPVEVRAQLDELGGPINVPPIWAVASPYLPDDKDFCSEIQSCHDEAHDLADFHAAIEQRLRALATKHHLTIPATAEPTR